jgi:ribose transport system substrate-binding protein
VRIWIIVCIATLALAAAFGLSATHLFAPHAIAVIAQAAPEQLWESEHAGAALAAERSGVRIYWNAPDREDDVQRQISLVEKITKDHYNGLVLAPTQALALMIPVQRAVDAGIPVVVIDTALPLPAGKHLSYIVNDETESGKLVAKRVGTILHGTGKLSILGIDPNSKQLMTRLRALEATLHQDYPEVVIADRRTGSLDDTWAEQVAQESLTEAPDVGVVVTLNVTSTFGLYRAILKLPKEKRPKIVAIDQDFGIVALLRMGEIDSLVISDTYGMGYLAVGQVEQMRRGNAVPPYTQMKPVLMTAQNMYEPALQQRLSGWWRTTH